MRETQTRETIDSASTTAPQGAAPSPAGSTTSVQLKAALKGLSYDDQVQLLAPDARGEALREDIHAKAEVGLRGGGGPLPHRDAIQKSFGPYDVSTITAHTDAQAQLGAASMGADAYATGNHVVLGQGGGGLHTVAHEAAHVMQQREGVALSGGIGQAGDRYEQHADRVADAVVAGADASPILAEMSGGGATSGVQQRAVQQRGALGGRRGRGDAMRAPATRAAFFAPATIDELVSGVTERVVAGQVLSAVSGLRLYLHRERQGAPGSLLEQAEALHARAQLLGDEADADAVDVATQDASVALVTDRLIALVDKVRAQARGDGEPAEGPAPMSREATFAAVSEALNHLGALALSEAEASLGEACASQADAELQGVLLVLMARLAVLATQARAGVLDDAELATTGGAIGASLEAILAEVPMAVEALAPPDAVPELTASLRSLAEVGQLVSASGLLLGWVARAEATDAVTRYHVEAVEAEMNALLRAALLGSCPAAEVDSRMAALAQVVTLVAADLDARMDETDTGLLVSPTPDELTAGAERGIWQQTVPRVIATARARKATLSLFAPVGPDGALTLLEIAPDADIDRLREEVELRYAKGRVDEDDALMPDSRTRDRLSADERALQDEKLRHNPHAADADRLSGVASRPTELKAHRARNPRGDDRVLPTASELHLEMRAEFGPVFQRFIAPRLLRVAKGRNAPITYEHPATSPVALTITPEDTVASLCKRYPDLIGPVGAEPAAAPPGPPAELATGSDHIHSTRSDPRWARTALPEALERAKALGRPVTVASQYLLETFWKVPRAELNLEVRPDDTPTAMERRAAEHETRLRQRALEVGDSDLAPDEVDVDAAFDRSGADIATRLSPTALQYACHCAVSQDQPVRLRAFVDEEGQWVELMVRPGDAPSDLMVRVWDAVRAGIHTRLAHNEVGAESLGVDGVPLGDALRGPVFRRLLGVANAQREAVFVRLPTASGAELRFEVWPGDSVNDALKRARPGRGDLEAPIVLKRDRFYERVATNQSASGSTREVHEGLFPRR